MTTHVITIEFKEQRPGQASAMVRAARAGLVEMGLVSDVRMHTLPEFAPGEVRIAELNGKTRILRYDPDQTSHLKWVMDRTYDQRDYVASNWDLTDSRLENVRKS